MILRELYYFDKTTMEPVDDDRYLETDDTSPLELDDTRKTRLKLKDINRARRAEEMHQKETNKDLLQIRAMYGLAAQAQPESV